MAVTRDAQKITKRVVDAAGARADRFIIWDAEIKGFGVLVLPTGVKSYFYQYRTPEGRKRRITIGQHGQWTWSKLAAGLRNTVKRYAPVMILLAINKR